MYKEQFHKEFNSPGAMTDSNDKISTRSHQHANLYFKQNIIGRKSYNLNYSTHSSVT